MCFFEALPALLEHRHCPLQTRPFLCRKAHAPQAQVNEHPHHSAAGQPSEPFRQQHRRNASASLQPLQELLLAAQLAPNVLLEQTAVDSHSERVDVVLLSNNLGMCVGFGCGEGKGKAELVIFDGLT